MQLSLAARDALEVEDVVDQPYQAVGVADRNVEHLLRLLRAIRQRPTRKQTKRPAQRSKWSAQFVRYRRDELVLHAVERAAFRGVSKRDNDAKRLEPFAVR